MKILLPITAAIALSSTTLAEDARAIMQKVDAQQAQTMNSSFVDMALTSCKFGLSQGQVRCTEQPRIKALETVSLETEAGSKSLMVIRQPVAEQGIGMLSYQYDDSSVQDETWLYLSALDRVKRIATGSGSNEEPASLFGSEFSTEDQETGNINDYNFELLGSEQFQGQSVWVIESTPTEERAKSSNYDSQKLWVDQERLIILKTAAFRDGVEIKRFQMSNIERINGAWLARSTTVMNLISNRLSNIKINKIVSDVQVEEDFLSQRALTDNAYREQGLSTLRQQAQE